MRVPCRVDSAEQEVAANPSGVEVGGVLSAQKHSQAPDESHDKVMHGGCQRRRGEVGGVVAEALSEQPFESGAGAVGRVGKLVGVGRHG